MTTYVDSIPATLPPPPHQPNDTITQRKKLSGSSGGGGVCNMRRKERGKGDYYSG